MMVEIVRAGCGALLLATLVDAFYPLADPEYYDTGDRFDPDVFELQPYESTGHYQYHPPRPPPRLKLVKKWTPPKTSPLQAVQKVFVSKPPAAAGGNPAMTDALGTVVLAVIAQGVGTLFLLLLGKLMVGMKAVLATNALALGLKLWKHVKKAKRKKLRKKVKVHKKPVKYHGHKKPQESPLKLELSTKQLKKLIKLLKKKSKNVWDE